MYSKRHHHKQETRDLTFKHTSCATRTLSIRPRRLEEWRNFFSFCKHLQRSKQTIRKHWGPWTGGKPPPARHKTGCVFLSRYGSFFSRAWAREKKTFLSSLFFPWHKQSFFSRAGSFFLRGEVFFFPCSGKSLFFPGRSLFFFPCAAPGRILLSAGSGLVFFFRWASFFSRASK